jgi:RNA polymerase sigma-70 factor (ECF subfamily)
MRPGSKRDPPASDRELVERAREGETAAFEALVRRHLPRAHGVALSIVRDSDEADDVCQETFLAALRRLDQLRDPARVEGWLLRIARNVALNHLKRSGRSVALPLAVLESVPGPGNPDVELRERGLQEELRAAVAHLSGLPRRVFELHEVEGWDHGEIAAELGISTGASRVHLFLARRTLRSKMVRPILEEI